MPRGSSEAALKQGLVFTREDVDKAALRARQRIGKIEK